MIDCIFNTSMVHEVATGQTYILIAVIYEAEPRRSPLN